MHKWWYSTLFGLPGGFTTMIGNTIETNPFIGLV